MMNSPHDIPSIPTEGPKVEYQKCGNCYILGSEAELKYCTGCRIVKYCSRECQTTHWKAHKGLCKKSLEHAALVAKADASGALSELLPPGVTLGELNQRLARWIKFHNLTFMAATVHALALPHDITRSRTHIVKMTVHPRLDHNGVTAKFFRIIDATVVKISEAQKYPAPWPDSLEQVALLREDSEKKGRGTIAAVGIECRPLSAQFVPFGSLSDLNSLVVLPNWKDIVIRSVENGTRLTEFGV